MKLIYRVNGSDLFIETKPEIIPQLKWKVEIHKKEFIIEKATLSYEEPEDVVYFDLKRFEEKEINQNDPQQGSEFECVFPWSQNIDSLTAGKKYTVIRIKGNFFIIEDDKGRYKKYRFNNTQFKRIK